MSHFNNQPEPASSGTESYGRPYHSPKLVALGPLQGVILGHAVGTPDAAGAATSTVTPS
jgi:hypothetical protein